MGAIADGSLAHGGKVIGVMPKALVDKEIAHTELTELVITKDMHERKAKMADLSDAFLVLPGGCGTLEEFFEQWTWAQIGYHRKPIGLFNVNGFFDPLMAMFDHVVRSGFMSKTHRDMLLCHPQIERILGDFATYTSPPDKTYDHGA